MIPLIEYVPRVWPQFMPTWHSDVLSKNLQDLVDGKIKRLMVTMPPRHGKSQFSSILLPSYVLAHPGLHKIMVLTYGQGLSRTFGGSVRDIIQLHEWRRISGGKEIRSDAKAKSEFMLTDGSEFRALGRGGSITGKGCTILICDDLIKNQQEADSELIMQEIMGFYDSVALTRLEHEDVPILILNTRWRVNDVTGTLIARDKEEGEGEGWQVMRIPAIAEENEEWEGNEGRIWVRKKGEALWADRFSVKRLQGIRAANPAEFTGLYQQNPHAMEGEIFKREYWKYYSQDVLDALLEDKEGFKIKIMSVDTAFKAKETNDYSVLLMGGMTFDGRLMLLDLVRERLEFTDLKAACRDMILKWKPDWTIIEDKASGTPLLQELENDEKVSKYTGFEALQKKYDKVDYAQASQANVRRGLVYLPDYSVDFDGLDWQDVFLDELTAFPNAQFDDQVDAFTQLAMFCRNYGLFYEDDDTDNFGIIGVA